MHRIESPSDPCGLKPLILLGLQSAGGYAGMARFTRTICRTFLLAVAQ